MNDNSTLLEHNNCEDFQIYYQPIVALVTQKVESFEALLRWPHPEQGLVSPIDLISVAERNGMMVSIDRCVLQRACHQMHLWQTMYPTESQLSVSVNLSRKEFFRPGFLCKQIDWTLQETGLSAANLKIEIAESFIIENFDSIIIALSRLKELGVQLVIDNFGVNKSFLGCLPHLPVDVLKIDRSLIHTMAVDSHAWKTIAEIVKRSHSLGIKAVAKGVETAVQLNQVRNLNFQYVQGYIFSKPVDSERASSLIIKLPWNQEDLDEKLAPYVAALNEISQFGSQYLGPTIVANYWQVTRPKQDWLKQVEVSHTGTITLQDQNISTLNPQQRQELQQWVQEFLKRSSQIIRNFAEVLLKKDLKPIARQLIQFDR
ncbi:MAG: EAL domain-containing protein [Cyanothece sp. SIO1E1]|nr:EAL domain-containing protein [Cyanothece sp. SIO1E1]